MSCMHVFKFISRDKYLHLILFVNVLANLDLWQFLISRGWIKREVEVLEKQDHADVFTVSHHRINIAFFHEVSSDD